MGILVSILNNIQETVGLLDRVKKVVIEWWGRERKGRSRR